VQKAEMLVQGLTGTFRNEVLKQTYDLAVEDKGVQVMGVDLRSCQGIAKPGEPFHGEATEYLIERSGSHGRKLSRDSTN